MKPGAFKDTTADFFNIFPIDITVAKVSLEVLSPRTTSNSLIMFAGLKK